MFLYQTPVQPETFIYQEEKHFSYIRTHTPFFESDFRICVAQKQGTFKDQDLILIEVKIIALINGWKNNTAYGKNPSKAGSWLLASAICFMLYVNSQLVMGLGAQSQQENVSFYTLIHVWKQYFYSKLTQNCYLHYNVTIFS